MEKDPDREFRNKEKYGQHNGLTSVTGLGNTD